MLNEQPQLLLRVLTGPNAGAEALLALGETIIGSAETSDVLLADPEVADTHVRVLVEEDLVKLQIEGAPVWVADTIYTEQTIPLTDYQVFRLGSSSCAIGRKGDDWPNFTPAELFTETMLSLAGWRDGAADPVERHVGAEEDIVETGPPSDEMFAAIAPARVLLSDRWRKVAVIGATSLTILLVAGIGVYSAVEIVKQSEPNPVQEVHTGLILQENLIKLGLEDQIFVDEMPNGQVLLTGYVVSSAELAALRGSLRELDVVHLLRVVALDRQKLAVETLISQIGGDLSVAISETGGTLVLSGFLPNEQLIELLVTSLDKEIPDLRPLETRIDTAATILAEIQKRLVTVGLAAEISARVDERKIRFEGEASDATRRSLAALIPELEDSWGRFVTFSDDSRATLTRVVSVQKVDSEPSESRGQVRTDSSKVLPFTVIVAGENALVGDALGRRYRIGDELPDGYSITDITANRVTAVRDGKTRTYSHRR